MSASPAHDEPSAAPAVEVIAIEAQTLRDIERGEMRYCDVCGSEELFGCVAAVVLGYHRAELCRDCWQQLVDAVKIAARCVK